MESADLSRCERGLAGRAAARALAVAALLATAQAAPAACTVPQAALGAALLRSEWRETDAAGRRLVREQGTLHEGSASLQVHCSAASWRLGLTHARGQRRYDGVSSTGASLTTDSRVRQTGLQLDALVPMHERGWLGVRLGQQWVQRDIADAGAVRGYPERFSLAQLLAGAGLVVDTAPGLRATFEAWLGAGPGGRLSLRLPHADPARLALGRSRAAAVSAWLGSMQASNDAAHWGWRAGLDWAALDIGAGPAQALMRNGVVVGGAAQPRTRHTSWRLGAELGIRF